MVALCSEQLARCAAMIFFFFFILTFIKGIVGIFCTLCPVRGRWSNCNKTQRQEGGVELISLSLGSPIGQFWITGTTPQRMNAARSKVSQGLRGSLPMKRWGVLLLITSELPRDKDETLLKKWRFTPSHLTVASLSPVWMRDGGKLTDV